MIWLASFPRSGNTFLRNILYEVYGLESSTFHIDKNYHLDKNYTGYPFVKTHLLPDQLIPDDKSIPVVYIIRDGRDALVSLAHHRKDIIVPGSDYYENLKAAIIAEGDSFFGGWSKNISEWVQRADIVIRYEDMLIDPVKETERIRALVDLPYPDESKVPRFTDLKFGSSKYGSGKDRGYSEKKMKELAEKNFRRGKAGSWQEEMPEELLDLFWSYHGDDMDRMGYSYEGSIKSLHPEMDYQLIKKLGKSSPAISLQKKKILIESDKIISPDNDGVKRYQVELLKGLLPLAENPSLGWHIDLFIQGEIYPLLQFKESIIEDFSNGKLEETIPSKGDKTITERFEQMLIKLIPHKFINFLHKHEIKIFHNTYEFLKKLIFSIIIVPLIRFVNFIKLILYRLFQKYKGLNSRSDIKDQLETYDLIHLPLMHHYKPFQGVQTKMLFTVHDLTHIFFPNFHTKINISNSKKGLDFIINNKVDIIAVSESTKKDLLKVCNIGDDQVYMVYEAADRKKFNFRINRDDNKKVREKYGIGDIGDYIVCLSTIEPRKNLENTIKGFYLLLEENPEIQLNLVIAGKKGWETAKLVLSETADAKRVFFTGFIDDKDIAAIYSDAIAMSYLSFYEGFGLPPLEAMCCGTPVIYGNNSSLIEVVGPGGLSCNPYDINDIKEKFEQIYFDKKRREKKSKDALKQSLKFSWRNTVIETLDIYKKIIDR